MEKNKIYIVSMYRWGSKENHSYVQGVYTEKHKAIKSGEKEREYRGGKYDPEILEFIPNTERGNTKIIVGLST